MAEASSFAIGKLFSDLIGCHVTFSEQSYASTSTEQQVYSLYQIKPMDSFRIVQADMGLISVFGGALIGLSFETIKQRVIEAKCDESLNDAMGEVMNIASRMVSIDDRAVFKGMHTDSGSLPTEAKKILRDPFYVSHFGVKVEGYGGGTLSLLSPY